MSENEIEHYKSTGEPNLIHRWLPSILALTILYAMVLLGGTAVVCIGGGLALWLAVGTLLNIIGVVTVRHETEKTECEEADGYRILFLGDLHFGHRTPSYRPEQIIAKARAGGPYDAVVIDGDILDLKCERGLRLARSLAKGLREFFSGAVVVYDANHIVEDPAGLQEIFDKYGFIFLRDEWLEVGPVSYYGLPYFREITSTEVWQIRDEAERRGPGAVLLSHKPDGVSWHLHRAFDLTLSGHTHGGGCWLIRAIADFFVMARSGPQERSKFAPCRLVGWKPQIISKGLGSMCGYFGWLFLATSLNQSEIVIVNLKYQQATT